MSGITVRNADRLATTPARRTALACLRAGIEAAHPAVVVREAVSVADGTLTVDATAYDLDAYDRVLVLGGGKAAGAATEALEALLGDRLDGGVIVVPEPADTDRVTAHVGQHPVPDQAGVAGAQRVLETARAADGDTLVLAVITGGGSALLPAPAGDVSLGALREVTDALLASGATIEEINAVRKHLSAIKGGRLAAAAAPATVVGLVFSDVVGNDLGVIASGPTAPDTSTFEEALAVLDRHGIDAPAAVRARLEAGAAGEHPETPRRVAGVTNHVLADGMTALRAAETTAVDRGYRGLVLSSRVRGEAREAAKTHVAIAEEMLATGRPIEPPAVVVSGGETTVTVTGEGVGGPNQEFALSGAIELAGTEGRVALAAADTDGRDGATDAAGALVDPATVDVPDDARTALDDNDAGTYLGARGALIDTGPTGTNVNDLRVLVVGGPPD